MEPDPKNFPERKNFLKPTWENPINKRENFSISLRKKKKSDIVKNKRLKIQNYLAEAKESLSEQKSQDNINISNEDNLVMEELKSKCLIEDSDPFTQLESAISFLTLNIATEDYWKLTSVFFKYLRMQTEQDETFSRGLVLEVSNFLPFVKLNLEMFKNGVQDAEVNDKKIILITQLTWLLVNISHMDCNQVCQKLVTSSDQIITLTSALINITDFQKFFEIKQNQEITDNVLWFWSNLIAEELQQDSQQEDQAVFSERICAKIVKDTCYLETIRLIVSGLKKETASNHKDQIKSIIWSMKNVCLHKNYVSKSEFNILNSFVLIVRQVLFQSFTLDTIDSDLFQSIVLLLIDMLLASWSSDNSDFQEYLLDTLDVKFILEKCLTSTDDQNLMTKGIILFGSLLQFDGNEAKVMKATMPETLEYVDHNVFGDSSKLFDDEYTIESKKKLIDLHIKSLWMLSNFVLNQELEGYENQPIISKDLFGKIIQIGMSSREIIMQPEISKIMWDDYNLLFKESMFVLTALLQNCKDEQIFFMFINDKAVIELLSYCILEQTQLNLSDSLVYKALHSLEIALNFNLFNDQSSNETLGFNVQEYLMEITQGEPLGEVLKHKNQEISEKAIQIEMDYIQNDDNNLLGDQNMINYENTAGGHLFDDTKYKI